MTNLHATCLQYAKSLKIKFNNDCIRKKKCNNDYNEQQITYGY